MDQRRVLVVESDNQFAEQVSRAFLPYGITADIVGDGTEGLQRAKSDQPDLILLCVELPNMSGYSICNKLKKNPELKAIPLVIMSSDATPDIFEQHKKLKTRAEDYLIKPFPMQELLEKIGRLIDLGQPDLGGDGRSAELTEPEVENDIAIALSDGDDDLEEIEEIEVDDELIEPADDALDEEPTQIAEEVDKEINMATEAAFAALELPDDEATRKADPMELLLPSEAATAEGLQTEGEPMTAPPVEALEVDLSGDEGDIEVEATAVEDFGAVAAEPNDLPPPPTPEFDASDIPGGEPVSREITVPNALPPDEEPTVEPDAAAEPEADGPEIPLVTLAEAAQELGPGPGSVSGSVPGLESELEPAEEAMRQQIQELERENRRLSDEVQNALARSPDGGGVSQDRELLNLREVINKKEKEILDLRDDIHSKERQILDHKDKVRELDRKVRDVDEKLLGVEREMLSAGERIEALNADKEQLKDREQGVKARLTEAKAEIDKAYGEIAVHKTKHQEEVERLNEAAQAAAEQHEQELTKLKDQQAGELERARNELEQAASEAEAAKGRELEQADQLRNEQLDELKEQHAEEVQRLRTEQSQALEQAGEEKAQALSEAEAAKEQALEQAAEEKAQALAEAEAAKEQALEQAAEEKAQALSEAEAAKERELEQADQLRNEQLTEAKEQHAGESQRLEESHGAAMEEKEAEHAGEKESLRTEHRAEVERLQQENDLAVSSLKQQQEDRVTGMQNRHSTQTEEQEQRHNDQRQELEGQLSEGQQKIEGLSGELEQTVQDLEGTRQRAAGLEVELESTRERVGDLEQTVAEHEQQASAYEDQLMKSYSKIRNDEALSDKAKRAMAVAITLLEEQKKVSAEGGDQPRHEADEDQPQDQSV
jgi:DNA-binding response OmpR family regulator